MYLGPARILEARIPSGVDPAVVCNVNELRLHWDYGGVEHYQLLYLGPRCQ